MTAISILLLQVNAFKCLCPSEYTGNECELPYSLCTRRTPCQNGAKCIDKAGTFDCQCAQGYSGKFCGLNIDECAPNPCQNNGVCISGLDSYSCKCQGGYTGVNCQIDIDDCAAKPCQNGGTCVDGLKSYSCQCLEGYSGANCEHAIDHCVGQPCYNGGRCVNTPTGYQCVCTPSYHGCRCTKGMMFDVINLWQKTYLSSKLPFLNPNSSLKHLPPSIFDHLSFLPFFCWWFQRRYLSAESTAFDTTMVISGSIHKPSGWVISLMLIKFGRTWLNIVETI